MAKKLLALVFAALLIVGSVIGVSAGNYDDVFGDLVFSELKTYGASELGVYQMRAFCVDPNGKYFFGGCLQGGPTMFKFDSASGKQLGSYQFAVDSGSYIKALCADDRGYVYNGIANAANDGMVYMSILEMDSFKETGYIGIEIAGKIGVNGCGIGVEGSNYYLYLMTNYDTDRLYKIDVTDVTKPAVVTSWGTDGYIDMAKLGCSDCGGVAVGDDGSIYVAAVTGSGSKGDTLLKLDASGAQIAKLDVTEPWSVSFDGGYVLLGTRNGADSQVIVVDGAAMKVVKEYTPDASSSGFSGAAIMNDKIYVCDHSENDRVLVSGALNIPQLTVEEEAPAVDNAAVADTGAGADAAAPATATAAPATFDVITVGVVSSIIALAGFAVAKKRG